MQRIAVQAGFVLDRASDAQMFVATKDLATEPPPKRTTKLFQPLRSSCDECFEGRLVADQYARPLRW